MQNRHTPRFKPIKIIPAMMQEKRMVGALQAEQNAKAAQTQAASQRAKDDFRAGEKAYDIAQAKAIQQQARDDYRAGEREYAVQQAKEVNVSGGKPLAAPMATYEPPWWKKIVQTWEGVKTWTNDHIIQPVNSTYTTVKNVVINTSVAIQKRYEQVKNYVIQKMEDSKTWAVNYYNSLPPTFSDKLYLIGRDTAIYTVTHTAEAIYQNITVPITKYSETHPDTVEKATQFINGVLEFIRPYVLDKVVDTNPQTMGWVDLGMTWLFELGSSDKDKLIFDSNSRLTQDIMQHTFIQNVKQAAIEKITAGNMENVKDECASSDTPQGQYPVCKVSQFGVVEFLRSLSLDKIIKGNLSEEYLGSYKVTINVEPVGDGKYIFHYQIKNSSTWESATRFRLDNDKNGSNDGIIPDISGRGLGIELGGRLDQSFEWSEEINISTGNP